ncbi:MAG TPA: hypothetical protein VFW96_18170 [Thermomicrobiales bacterium]|nr:hypothetical protein [Thermomicrobiales bacterium]
MLRRATRSGRRGRWPPRTRKPGAARAAGYLPRLPARARVRLDDPAANYPSVGWVILDEGEVEREGAGR